MKHLISLAALSAAFISAPAFADDSQALVIKDFIGTVKITTGDSFSVSGEKGDITEIRENGLIIDGNQTVDHTQCKSSGSTINISVGKKSWFKQTGGYKDLEDYPNIDITVPEGVHLEVADSVIFGIGETFGSVDAHIGRCGSLEIGDVSGPLDLRMSGSGDFNAGNVGPANVRVSGAGDASLGDMEKAVIKVSGSGDFKGGDVIDDIEVTSSGAGEIELGSLTGNLTYKGSGASDFYLKQINGDASITLTGSGDVEIDEGKIPKLHIKSSGGSRFVFDGTAGDVMVTSSGGGVVKVDDATGERDVKHSGGASVRIGDTRYKR